MSQGILIYALNNEQIDYVEIAYYAALQVKKHLKLPVALVTDSADWLYYKFPNHKEVFDMVIKIVHQSSIEPWNVNNYYGVGNLAFYNGTIWKKIKEGDEKVQVIHKTYKESFNEYLFDRIYEGIDIDKWCPNLSYSKGQHVWYENNLYRCHTDYEEKEEFSQDQYDLLIENIFDFDSYDNLLMGDKVLYNRVLWLKVKENKVKEKKKNNFDEYLFDRIYQGIDIDIWYPNLPYLNGQHVWYENNLYRCHTNYEEKEEFSQDQYDLLIETVFNFDTSDNLKIGDKVLHNRVLWLKIKEEEKEEDVDIYDFNENDFEKIYEGIDIDIWYPNLPYLKGQHVWYENTLYRCEIGYTEGTEFSKEKYISLVENVKDLKNTKIFKKGETFLYNRNLWLCNINYGNELIVQDTWYDTKNLEPVYEGIDIDKWYPNLPYLKGQHVWYENILYRCNTDYEEDETFSLDKYDIVVKNVKDLTSIESFTKGDILLFDRKLWMSTVKFGDPSQINKIRDDLWEDTRERHLSYNPSIQYRRYFDGALSNRRLKFKNDIRIKSYELSPFDETLVIDCDYFINNDTLKYCWEQPHDFLIFKEALDLSGYRYDPRLHTLSDKSIDFYWATVFFFRKTKNTEIFFNYLGHIQDNWNYYRYVYQIQNSMYRNDFAFSIAIHVMNGFQQGSWAHPLPGKLYYSIDKDVFVEYKDTTMKFLLEKEKYKGEYTLIKTDCLNVHVMNKFSISRILREVEYV
jgi:hypothetical protein